MPISRWLKWMAWAKLQGPLGGLRDDYHAAEQAMWTAVPHTAEEDRNIPHFLPPWRRPSDYQPWISNWGPDMDPQVETFEID